MNIIITGASSGIGLALKNHYQSLGNTVFDISKSGEGYECDVTDRASLSKIIEDIMTKVDHIDILINCAGFGVSGAIELVPIENIKAIFDVNVIGAVNMLQLVLPHMKKGGKVINISSVLALFPTPFRGYYCASKSALSTINDALYMELKESGIQVSAFCPSEIKTNFSKNRVKSFETNERYGEAISLSTKHIDDKEEKRMPIDKAVKILVRWIDKKHLKPQYIMTFKFKLLYALKNIFPKSVYLKVCNKMFNKKSA